MTGWTGMSMEQALERSDWLRGLAEELVGDPALAGDLAADALRVLHARESVRNPRAFLRGVVRNLARRHRRSEQSRARREHSTARAEALPSTVELASQLEIQRILMAEVSALAPGARGVILLRFYHGLSCAEIARRQGLEPEAVRKRLERGLAALRARLDGKFDDRTTWAGLVGSLLDFDGARVAPAGSVSVFAGTLIMTTTKITAAAAILVAAAWFTVKGLGDGDSVSFPTQDGVAAAPSAEEADEPPARGAASPGVIGERTLLQPPAEPAVEDTPRSVIHVVESDGALLSNTRAFVVDSADVVGELRTDDEGTLSLEATGDAVALVVERRAALPHMERLVLDAGERTIQLPIGARLAGVVLVDGGPPTGGIALALHSDHTVLADSRIAKLLADSTDLDVEARTVTTANGSFSFDGLPADWSGSLELPLRYRRMNADFHIFDHDQPHFDAPQTGLVIELRSHPVLTAQVVEHDGMTPVPRAQIFTILHWKNRTGGAFGLRADDEGRFELALREIDPLQVRLSISREDGSGQTELRLSPERIAQLELGPVPLTPDRPVLFRALDPAGAPVPGAVATWDVNAPISEPTDADGLGRLVSVPEVVEELHIAARGHAMSYFAVPTDPAQRVEVVLRPTGVLVIDVRSAAGEPLSTLVDIVGPAEDEDETWTAERRLLRSQLAGASSYYQPHRDGSCSYGLSTDDTGRVEIQSLPSGRYSVVVKDSAGNPAHEQKLPPVAAGEERLVVVTLAAPLVSLEGRVVDPLGAPLVDAEVQVLSRGNMRLTKRTDQSGRFVLERLLADDVHIEVSMVGFVSKVVGPLHPDVELVVTLERGREVRVQVIGDRGAVVEGLTVFAVDSTGEERWDAHPDADGNAWVLTELPAEPLTLVVEGAGKREQYDLDPLVPVRRVEFR